MLEPRVCPDCGNGEMQRDAPATLRLSGHYYGDDSGIGFEESVAERLDVERDFDTLTCTDCGADHDPSDLVSPADYESEGQ